MARYILHGGEQTQDCLANQQFFAAMAKHIPNNGTWLGIYFSAKDENVEKYFQYNVSEIQKYTENKKINFMRATQENWEAEIEQADVIYLRGGTTSKLWNVLSQSKNVHNIFTQNKVFAGESAGVKVLMRQSILRDGSVLKGLGILPYDVVVHALADGPEHNKPQDTSLLNKPILHIPETHFVMIDI